jgi:hypothetical protein
MLDGKTVTPGTDTNTLGEKRERDNSRTRRRGFKQTLIGDISLPSTAGKVLLEPVFFEHAAEVRDSPKFLRILNEKLFISS